MGLVRGVGRSRRRRVRGRVRVEGVRGQAEAEAEAGKGPLTVLPARLWLFLASLIDGRALT